MATTNSIGTSSRDYSTITAWIAAVPSTPTGGYIGECYNDSEFTQATETYPITLTKTTSSGNNVILRTASGQSFKDNASVQTNALKYNQSNGVGVKNTTSYKTMLVNLNQFTDVQYIQFLDNPAKNDRAVWRLGVGAGTYTADHPTFDGCLFETNITGTDFGNAIVYNQAGIMKNCLLIRKTGSSNTGVESGYIGSSTPEMQNCTIVRTSNLAAGGTCWTIKGGTLTIKNCAWFGWQTERSASPGGTHTGNNNSSDLAISFGSSNQASKTYANQFESTTAAASDFRAKSGADLLDNGTSSGVPSTDIAGTSRPSGSAYDIGCWELVAAAAGLASKVYKYIQAVNRASTY